MVKGNKLTKIYFDKIYTNGTVSRPMTPGQWASQMTYMPVTRLGISCGGGVGGSHWFEYVDTIDFSEFIENTEPMIKVKTWNGKEMVINKNFIVDLENFEIAHAKYNSQNWNFEQGIYDCYYLVEPGHRLTLVD